MLKHTKVSSKNGNKNTHARGRAQTIQEVALNGLEQACAKLGQSPKKVLFLVHSRGPGVVLGLRGVA